MATQRRIPGLRFISIVIARTQETYVLVSELSVSSRPSGELRTYNLYISRNKPPPLNTTTVPSTLSLLVGHTVVSAKQNVIKLCLDGWCCAALSKLFKCWLLGSVCSRVRVRLSSSGRRGGGSNVVTTVTRGAGLSSSSDSSVSMPSPFVHVLGASCALLSGGSRACTGSAFMSAAISSRYASSAFAGSLA